MEPRITPATTLERSNPEQSERSRRVESGPLRWIQSQGRVVPLSLPWREANAGQRSRGALSGNTLHYRRRRLRVSRELGDAPRLYRGSDPGSQTVERMAGIEERSVHGFRDVVRAVHRHLRSSGPALPGIPLLALISGSPRS